MLCAIIQGKFFSQTSKFLLFNMEGYKNPIVGRPIVVRYNWNLSIASFFWGHFLKDFYIKFDTILTESVSPLRVLSSTKYSMDCFLFTIHFKSPYTFIPLEDAISMIQSSILKMLSQMHIWLYDFQKSADFCSITLALLFYMFLHSCLITYIWMVVTSISFRGVL